MGNNLATATLREPVTAHMHQDFTRVLLGQTVGEALDGLRHHPPKGRIIYFYVVDEQGRLQGVVPTRRLILSPREQALADLMVRRVVTLPAEATVENACEFFIQHRLLALPVVDSDKRLLGVVDMELYTDELGQLGEASKGEDLFQLLGVKMTTAQQRSPLLSFRHRVPWLSCNLAAGILAAFLSGVYEDELNRVVALAFFIPVVLNLAESVSSQSVSLALQWLHGSPPSLTALLGRLRSELATGFLLGLASSSILALLALVWLGQWKRQMALCLLGGITGGVAVAALLGITIPFVLHWFRLEPRVAAGPVTLAAADVVTILLYFNLARWLLA
ncbi:MAG TPA: magnesium transporter [Gemmataceae bacterium]|nr:magnesium transporter [Gemmataceae bacterium]